MPSVLEVPVDSATRPDKNEAARSQRKQPPVLFEGRVHFGPPAFGYSLAFAMVLISGVLHLSLAPSTDVWAPFVLFYPAIAIASFLGGVGPGLFSVIAGATFAYLLFPNLPGPFHWIAFAVVSPLMTSGFAHLRELRDRAADIEREYARYRYVSDQASDWIFLVEGNGRIRFINHTACAQLGWPAASVTGKELVGLVKPSEQERMRSLLIESRTGASPPSQFVFCNRHKAEVTLEIACTGVRVDGELVFHLVGRDISERLLVETRLRELRQWESLGVLAGGLAHDFNNLLTAIIGNTSLAKGILDQDHAAVPMLESAIQASERSAELIRLILASSGYRSRQTQEIQIDRLVSRLASSEKFSGNVRLHVSAEPGIVHFDNRSLEILLWSLMTNAVESYGETKGFVRVDLAFCSPSDNTTPARFQSAPNVSFEEGAQPSGKFFVIAVEDHGCGMTTDVLDHAFQPFYSTKFTGRGLGLPAVRGIVRAYNGKLRVRTAPERGTRVEVLLPA